MENNNNKHLNISLQEDEKKRSLYIEQNKIGIQKQNYDIHH